MAPYRHRYNPGRERALQHIEEGRRLSQELGGTDEDVKKYFFSLPEAKLNRILDMYEHTFGRRPREYAQQTIKKWRTGQVTMSGLVASRLFKLLPPVMPLPAKYQLIQNLWNHVGPHSKKTFRIGLDAQLQDVLDAIEEHIEEVVVQFKIPEGLERRFEWLASGDSHLKQELLNHIRHAEKSLVIEGARIQLPVLLSYSKSDQGHETHRLAQILKIGNHEIELGIDKAVSGSLVLEEKPTLGRSINSDANLNWLWWIVGAAALLLFSVLAPMMSRLFER